MTDKYQEALDNLNWFIGYVSVLPSIDGSDNIKKAVKSLQVLRAALQTPNSLHVSELPEDVLQRIVTSVVAKENDPEYQALQAGAEGRILPRYDHEEETFKEYKLNKIEFTLPLRQHGTFYCYILAFDGDTSDNMGSNLAEAMQNAIDKIGGE